MFFCLAVVSWPSSLGYQARRFVPNSFGVLFLVLENMDIVWAHSCIVVWALLEPQVIFPGLTEDPALLVVSCSRPSSVNMNCSWLRLCREAVQTIKNVFLGRGGQCCSENRLLVQNLTAIFSNDVSRALKTMSIYTLRGIIFCWKKKTGNSPGTQVSLSALCPAVPLAGSGESGAVPCWAVPACSWWPLEPPREPESRAVTMHLQPLQSPDLLSSTPQLPEPQH